MNQRAITLFLSTEIDISHMRGGQIEELDVDTHTRLLERGNIINTLERNQFFNQKSWLDMFNVVERLCEEHFYQQFYYHLTLPRKM